MKARGPSFEQEAARLLRDISMYQVLRKEQLLRLYPGKEQTVRMLLAYLVNQNRIVLQKGLYYMATGRPDNINFGLLDAVWVLVDFIDRVEFHCVGEFPAKVIFTADGEVYEVVYAERGKETMLSQLMGRQEGEPPHYLVLVEDSEQIPALNLPSVRGYCTVSPNGEVQYYQKEEENLEQSSPISADIVHPG